MHREMSNYQCILEYMYTSVYASCVFRMQCVHTAKITKSSKLNWTKTISVLCGVLSDWRTPTTGRELWMVMWWIFSFNYIIMPVIESTIASCKLSQNDLVQTKGLCIQSQFDGILLLTSSWRSCLDDLLPEKFTISASVSLACWTIKAINVLPVGW